LTLAGCRELHPPRLDNLTARELSDAGTRYPIGTTARTEALYVEVAPTGEGLSPNQETDVYRFIERYKAEGSGRLKIAAPASAKGHLTASRSVRQIEELVIGAGIPQRAIEPVRSDAGGRQSGAIKLAYERPVAVAPHCGDWPEDLGQNRERLPYPQHGCATQRNLALTVANSRDLNEPQDETPRSSELRSSHWGKYTGKSTSPTGSGSAPPPAPAAAPAPAGGAPGLRP
jgi:pilus assembly protein CpaD